MTGLIISFLLLVMIFIFVSIDTFINIENKIVSILIWVIKAPLIIFEYLVLFWFWGGDGTYTLLTTPICFIVFISLQLLFLKKHDRKSKTTKFLKSSIVLLTPVISVLITYLIAKVIGVQINIQ